MCLPCRVHETTRPVRACAVLLGIVKQLVKADPSMRVVVTSATLDVEKFQAYFADAMPRGNPVPAVQISGMPFFISRVLLVRSFLRTSPASTPMKLQRSQCAEQSSNL